MAKLDLIEALADRNRMAEYLEVRNDDEIIADIKSVMAPEPMLRDQFAMAAMQAMLTRPDATVGSENGLATLFSFVTEQSFLIADAMLKAREASHG